MLPVMVEPEGGVMRKILQILARRASRPNGFGLARGMIKALTLPVTVVVLLVFPAAAAQWPIAGTWQGKLYGQAAVTLNIKNHSGKLSGTVVFYLLRNNGAGFKTDLRNAHPLALIDPGFDGRTFSFQVSHREAHPPRTLSDTELVRFQMELTGEDEGQLRRLNYGSEDAAVKMRRKK